MKAEEIKTLRTKLDLSQQDFADLVGVSKRSVANYESGESSPNNRTLLKLNSLANEPSEDCQPAPKDMYSKDYYKDRYIEVLEENRDLHKELKCLGESKRSLKKDN